MPRKRFVGCTLFILLAFAGIVGFAARRVFGYEGKETTPAYVLVNSVVVGDHKDDYLDWDDWNDTHAVPLYRLEGNVTADVCVKYDKKDVYIRARSISDKATNPGDRCDLWFDPLHNGTSKLPQTDDVRISLFWVTEARFFCNRAFGTGTGWTNWWDKLPDGRDLVRDRLSDSYVSQISGCVVYEFRLPRSLVCGNFTTIGFGVYVQDSPIERFNGYRGGTSVWPHEFGDSQKPMGELPLDKLGILCFTGVPIPEFPLCASLAVLFANSLLATVSIVRGGRRRKGAVSCNVRSSLTDQSFL
jgi:hypothetical protein